MKIGSINNSGYLWFKQIIKIIDAVTYLNLQSTELTKDLLFHTINSLDTKVQSNAIVKFNNMQSNALLSYNIWNGQINAIASEETKSWTIISIDKFKQVSACANVALKTNDFLVISTVLKFLGKVVYIYCIYDSAITAQQLNEMPLQIFTLTDDFDFYNFTEINLDKNNYRFTSKNNIELVISKETKKVIGCFMKEEIPLSETAMGVISSIISDLSCTQTITNSFNKMKTTRDIANIRLMRSIKGIEASDEEILWLCATFGVSFEDATNFLDHIIKVAAKGKSIKVFNTTFDIIDILRYNNNILMIRTTYFNESSQLILLFDVDTSIHSLAFFVIDVFPHQGKNELEYTIIDTVVSASRKDIFSSSTVKINIEDKVYVNEKILIKYNGMSFNIEDTIYSSNDDEEENDENIYSNGDKHKSYCNYEDGDNEEFVDTYNLNKMNF